jgi:hypothetical protein
MCTSREQLGNEFYVQSKSNLLVEEAWCTAGRVFFFFFFFWHAKINATGSESEREPHAGLGHQRRGRVMMAVPSAEVVPFEWVVSQEDVDDLYQRLDNVSRCICSVGCLLYR